MEQASRSGCKPATRFGFDFSWADEVEREEREQQQLAMEQKGREAKKEQQQIRADPFSAARPREVVLAEKGVDWRARDRELDAAARPGPSHVAVPAARVPAADTATPSLARTVPVPACARRSTPARRAPWHHGSGRTPGPRRHDAESTPQAKDAPPVSRSAWGGGKRKCAGEVPAAATARRARAVGDQGRTVFGELNVRDGRGSSFRSGAKKSCNSGRSETEGSRASDATVADGGGSRGCCATAATGDQSAVGQKRKGRKRGRREGSKKTENHQTLLL